MTTRRKRAIRALVAIVVLLVCAGIAFLRSMGNQAVDVAFLGYTNSAAGGLSALLEIRNRGTERIARNSCRIHPEPADAGYWYAADVPSRRLEPGEAERLAVAFPPRSMTRWRATIIHVRNPTDFEYRLMRGVDWLNDHGWAPSALRKWRDGFSGGQTSTDWIVAPATNKAL